MTFDQKRHKTFKWLDDIVKGKKIGKLAKTMSKVTSNVYARYGRFYASNGFMIACVEYPEFSHVGDDEWRYLESFETDNKMHLENPIWKTDEFTETLSNEFFEKFFIDRCDAYQLPIDVNLFNLALQGFKLNSINPLVTICKDKLELSGHNESVSIRVVIMGRKY